MNPYCSIPPTFVSPLSNRTVTVGDTAQLYCNVSGNPEPSIWWFKNGAYLPEEHKKILTIENVTRTDAAHIFRCIAGNVVANLSSDDAYLLVEGNVLTLGTYRETACMVTADNSFLIQIFSTISA